MGLPDLVTLFQPQSDHSVFYSVVTFILLTVQLLQAIA